MRVADTGSKLRQRTDGRLDRSRDPVILDAALAAVTANGYEAASMDDIAARAGVGKAAIYRRWSSKTALIADAVLYSRPELLRNDAPDTGTLAGDLEELIQRTVRTDDELVTNELVLRVALETTRDPNLETALEDLLLMRGKRIMSTMLERATARGEIPGDRDHSLVAEVLTAMALLRVLRGQSVDADFVRRAIDTVVLPAIRR